MRHSVALDQPALFDVHSIGDVCSETKVSRRVEDAQAREVAMVASSALERLAFALVTPLPTEQSRSLADEHVAVDNAPVMRIEDDTDV